MVNRVTVGLLGVMAFAALGSAAPIVFNVTATNGATATASFNFGVNTLSLTLTNTSIDPKDVAWNLSAFSFDLTGATGTVEASASSPTFRTVDGVGGHIY